MVSQEVTFILVHLWHTSATLPPFNMFFLCSITLSIRNTLCEHGHSEVCWQPARRDRLGQSILLLLEGPAGWCEFWYLLFCVWVFSANYNCRGSEGTLCHTHTVAIWLAVEGMLSVCLHLFLSELLLAMPQNSFSIIEMHTFSWTLTYNHSEAVCVLTLLAWVCFSHFRTSENSHI